MKPRLVRLRRSLFALDTGVIHEAVFALVENEVTIGRDAANLVHLHDASVSRRHCLIRCDTTRGQFSIVNLSSLNGTFVNHQPVTQPRPLNDGDVVRIGKEEFLFLTGEADEADALNKAENRAPVRFDAAPFDIKATQSMRLDEAAHLMARDLAAFVQISLTINSIHDLSHLEAELLRLVCEVIPAERAAILLNDANPLDDSQPDFLAARTWHKTGDETSLINISRTIIERIVRERLAVLSRDVLQDASLATSTSLSLSNIASILAAPLTCAGKTLGIIYLDTSDEFARFDEDHLRFLIVVAGVAGVALENARRMENLERENERLRCASHIAHDMIGDSEQMKNVYRCVAKVAPTEASVLVRGESGTGKELVARAIHTNSPRAGKPFVAVNCATLSETLLESDLFGHEKGAFTGATIQKRGKLEVADGGTLFLDEVGELAPALQAKLLRVLQERTFERVGGTRTLKVDVRVVAATNKDLEAAIAINEFRADLYYRLNVVSITMPALRERGARDVLLLANYFARQSGERCKRQITGISTNAQKRLAAYDYPGNVRELQNAIERAVVLGSTEIVLAEDLPEAFLEIERARFEEDTEEAAAIGFHEAVRSKKCEVILRALEQAAYNYTNAANTLGVHPNYLHRLIRNLNIKPQIEAQANSKAR